MLTSSLFKDYSNGSMPDKNKFPQKVHTYTDTLADSGDNNKIETKGNRPQLTMMAIRIRLSR
jgi:hypothetical protein